MNASDFDFYGRMIAVAFSYILIVSAAIYYFTRRADVVRQYCTAHLIAFVFSAAIDIFLAKYLLQRFYLTTTYMGMIFLFPIAFFVAFSIYICHRGTTLHAQDILIPLIPLVICGFLVALVGDRGMGDYDVLGAWFVSAGCGGVDIVASFGPAALSKRPYIIKAAGYGFLLTAVYLILPLATR